MDQEEKKNQGPMQINIPDELVQGTYSNMAVVSHSSADFVVDFVCIMPGMEHPQLKSRIVMAPEHAKRLMLALNDNVQKYEEAFGGITIHNTQMPATANFTLPKGEA